MHAHLFRSCCCYLCGLSLSRARLSLLAAVTRRGGGDYGETQSEDEISIETINSTSHDNTVEIIIIILFRYLLVPPPMEVITHEKWRYDALLRVKVNWGKSQVTNRGRHFGVEVIGLQSVKIE